MLKTNSPVLDFNPSYRRASGASLPHAAHLTALLLFVGICAFWGAILYLAVSAF